jgi:hypothetical protein
MLARIRTTDVALQFAPSADVAEVALAGKLAMASLALNRVSVISCLAIAAGLGRFLIPAEFIRTGALAAAERPRSAIICPTSTNPIVALFPRGRFAVPVCAGIAAADWSVFRAMLAT